MLVEREFTELIGEALIRIDGGVGTREMVLTTKSGKVYKLYHNQDCCENVRIEDICGDTDDLIGIPILAAAVITDHGKREENDPYTDGTWTRTFYSLRTILGSVTIRWLGESNGWYGEEVTFSLDEEASLASQVESGGDE